MGIFYYLMIIGSAKVPVPDTYWTSEVRKKTGRTTPSEAIKE